jgi:type IV secretion system protein VirB10
MSHAMNDNDDKEPKNPHSNGGGKGNDGGVKGSNNGNARFEEPGIVAVNARGASGNDLAKKMMFIGAVAGICIVGSVFGFNKWRADQKSKDAEQSRVSKFENKPAQVGNKRQFEVEAKAAAPSPAASSVAAAGCKDVTVLDGTGKPIVGKDGQPIRVGCDGKLVPAIDPGAAPSSTGNSPSSGQTPPKPPSRYGGDVLLQGSVTGSLGAKDAPTAHDSSEPNPQSTLALMQKLMGGAPGHSNAGGMDDGGGSSSGFIKTSATQTSEPATPNDNTIPNQQGVVGALLTPTVTPKVTAAKIGDRNMLLAKGAQIDCALTTRVISEVSGFASCLLTSNIYSDNGKVLLLERGSEAQGEYVAAIQQGQRRLFVLWQRVKTPSGVVIALDSPAADGLGTMGLNGHVDNRWWDRLGAAFLLSFVKDAIAIEIAKSSNGANSNAAGAAYQNTTRTGEQMAERLLSASINIKPTVYKNQGDRASIYVARDLDFSSVYALRAD